MARVVGDIAVAVGADVSGLQAGMRKGGDAVRNFERDAVSMGAKFAKVGAAVVAAAAAIGVGIVRATNAAAKSATEIQNLSRLSGVTTTEFQKLAAAGETVGFSQEKMADIFKDVNDKFGDFLTTGAGPLKDFFEEIAPQVGVTADQFARLSGPDALQLYVQSLQDANVSQQQMTFFMEALANDATALIPLLADSGKEMKRIGDEAMKSGRVIDSDLIQSGAALDRKLAELAGTIRNQFNQAMLENADEIKALAITFTETFIPALIAVGRIVATVVEKIAALVRVIGSAIGKVQEFKAASRETAEDMRTKREDALTRRGNSRVDGNGFEVFDPRGDDVFNGVVNPFSTPADTQSPTSLLRSTDTDESRAAALQVIQDQVNAELSVVEEGRKKELSGARAHVAALEEVETAAFDRKLDGYRGAFGDLSTLMQSENDKLFNIGKAAAIASSIVEGYSSAVSAWDKGMKIGGPPVAAAFTAASLAKTGALIASIQSSSPRSTSPGGTAGAAGSVPESTVSRNVAIQLQGEIFDRKSVLGLINGINEAVEDGAVIRLV